MKVLGLLLTCLASAPMRLAARATKVFRSMLAASADTLPRLLAALKVSRRRYLLVAVMNAGLDRMWRLGACRRRPRRTGAGGGQNLSPVRWYFEQSGLNRLDSAADSVPLSPRCAVPRTVRGGTRWAVHSQ